MTKVAKPQDKKVKNNSKTWQFLCSVKLAFIIIVIMAVACVVGTLILQMRPPEDYVSRYGNFFATLFQAIQFNDIFHSYWFAFLLILLCVNLGCCTVKRWRNTVLQIGFLITHISIILILAGCVIDMMLGEKGGVNVYEGKSVDYYLNRADYKKVPLDFQVYCDDFIIERHPPKFRLVSFVKSKDLQKVIPVKPGKKINIPGSNYAVTIKDYFPDAEYRQEAINTSNEPDNPAIYVQMLDSNHVTAEGWLLAKDRNWYNDTKRDLKVEYLWADNDEEYERFAKAVGKGTKPKLDIAIEGKNIFKSVLVEEGKSISIDGTDYVVEIKQLALDYANRDAPLKEQSSDNPAVRVEISGPQGAETRWTFSKYPDYWDKAHQAKYKDVKLTCNVPDDFSETANSLKIVQNKEGKQTLSYISGGKLINITDWEIEKSYDIDETGLQMRIVKYFPSHSAKRDVVRRSGNHEGHNHGPGEHVGTPAISIEMEGPRGKVSDWMIANNPPMWYPDRNFALLYEQSGMAIKDYKSILRVVDGGKTVMTKTIEVNDPMKYKGYVFYQSSYDPEGERYTGLQVTRNPGLDSCGIFRIYSFVCGCCFYLLCKAVLKTKIEERAKGRRLLFR